MGDRHEVFLCMECLINTVPELCTHYTLGNFLLYEEKNVIPIYSRILKFENLLSLSF